MKVSRKASTNTLHSAFLLRRWTDVIKLWMTTTLGWVETVTQFRISSSIIQKKSTS